MRSIILSAMFFGAFAAAAPAYAGGTSVVVPGVNIQAGENGTSLVAPGVNIQAGPNGVSLNAPGMNINANGADDADVDDGAESYVATPGAVVQSGGSRSIVSTPDSYIEDNGTTSRVITPDGEVYSGPDGSYVRTKDSLVIDTPTGSLVQSPNGVVQTGVITARPVFVGAEVIENALSKPIVAGADLPKIDLTVNFDFNSAKLTKDGKKQVAEVARALKSSALRGGHFRLEGHTDNVGKDAYNLDLSYRRASEVARILMGKQAVLPDNLTAQGFGARRPVASNDSDLGRALNRRVTLVRVQ